MFKRKSKLNYSFSNLSLTWIFFVQSKDANMVVVASAYSVGPRGIDREGCRRGSGGRGGVGEAALALPARQLGKEDDGWECGGIMEIAQ
jgi:hypothetical protein